MDKSCKGSWCLAVVMLLVFLVFTVAVMKVDVQAIGPEGTKVGLAHSNERIAEAVGVHLAWDKVVDILGYASIAGGLGFAVLGLKQWISRKSLMKVDGDILALGVLYILLGVIYVIFEKVVINYRPVLMEEGLEPSYPSSHTVLGVVVLCSFMIQAGLRIQDPTRRTLIRLGLGMVLIVMLVGRVISGVHWFSDIVGSMLLSAALVSAYSAAANQLYQRPQPNKRRFRR